MPTTIYTKQAIASITHAGKAYEIKDGAVDVPDDAAPVLCESHGFTTIKAADGAESKGDEKPKLEDFNKVQLIEAGIALGAEIKTAMTKDEIFAIVKPLWEAKQAA